MNLIKFYHDLRALNQQSQFLPVEDVMALREQLSESAIIVWINAKTKDRVLRLAIKAITWLLAYYLTVLEVTQYGK